MSELLALLNADGVEIDACRVSAKSLAALFALIDNGTISGKIAKTVFEEMYRTGADPESVVAAKGLTQVSDEGELAAVIDQVLVDSPKELEQYRSGKDKLFGFFVGQVMKRTQGKANPAKVNELLKAKLAG
jgi:aspartyl-tRNA(Asn)/glutamyl-tRNA(Gln) amidotransferase subunit B